MNYMFYGCKNIKNIQGISKWDTKNVTNMSGMFSYCSSLNNLEGIKRSSITAAIFLPPSTEASEFRTPCAQNACATPGVLLGVFFVPSPTPASYRDTQPHLLSWCCLGNRQQQAGA